MSTIWPLARRSAWAHRAGHLGTATVLALAGALVGVSGVMIESAVRSTQDPAVPGAGLLLMLAGSFAGTVIVVAVLVVVATVALALRGRHRELTLLRTIGATRPQLRGQIGAEVLIAALVAAPFGAALGLLLARQLTPLLREAGLMGSSTALTLSPLPILAATLLLAPCAWVSGRLALRGTLRSTPGQAVRTGSSESSALGNGRRIAAGGVGTFGIVAAFSPLIVPGTVGSAAAATSAFLIVGAAALAGPALLRAAFVRVLRRDRRLGPSGRLAAANLRGFAQRLSIVIVPLALALTAGTVQTTVDRSVAEAATTQLREGLAADLIIAAPAGSQVSALAQIQAVSGVAGVAALSSAPASVRTDADLAGILDALAWEPTSVRSIMAGATGRLLDPGVSEGSLDALAEPQTVAVSADVAFTSGLSIGDRVHLRWADGSASGPRVVALYDRGLGFGDYLVGPSTLGGADSTHVVEALLIDAEPGALAAVRSGVRDLALAAQSPSSYAAGATQAGAAERRLSTVLLLGLLAFVFLAAANTLMMVTARRRTEFRLLGRLGATRAQLLRMTAVEALLTGGLAWLIGTLAMLPAIAGVSLGLLGVVVPPVDLASFVSLSAAVVVLPLLTIVPATAWLLYRSADRSSRASRFTVGARGR